MMKWHNGGHDFRVVSSEQEFPVGFYHILDSLVTEACGKGPLFLIRSALAGSAR